MFKNLEERWESKVWIMVRERNSEMSKGTESGRKNMLDGLAADYITEEKKF